ncbi:MAG: putative transcriptional regulator of viral defense system [Halieaceae bacterium]|jgi:predicted transcriptional regulator of viral defense system
MSDTLEPSKKQQVIDYAKNHPIVRPSDLTRLGLPKDYLYQLSKEQVLVRIGRGMYQWPNRRAGNNQSLIEAVKQAPNAVVALLSALSFHELTTQNPHEIWLAIDRKSWRPKIQYPPVRFVTLSGQLMSEGVERHTVDGEDLKVFSVARTVVDCFKYRHKIGLEVALEALREGWLEKRFTIDELVRYAELCRVKNVMQPYLESLV